MSEKKYTPEENWDQFWKDIVTNPDGSINLDQLKKELADFSFVMEQVPKVYCHITGNRMSYITYKAEDVIRVADDHFNEQLREAIKDEDEHPRPAAPPVNSLFYKNEAITFLDWVANYNDENGDTLELVNGNWYFKSDEEGDTMVNESDLWDIYKLHYPDESPVQSNEGEAVISREKMKLFAEWCLEVRVTEGGVTHFHVTDSDISDWERAIDQRR